MALNWCFNEPWPTAANNSIVNWPNIPKPGFYAVKNACRPFLASAQIKKFMYTEGEVFETDIWILNDLPSSIGKGKVIVKIKADNFELKLLNWEYDALSANTNLSGPTVRCKLPFINTSRFKLILEVEGHPEYSSEYTLLYRPLLKDSSKRNTLN